MPAIHSDNDKGDKGFCLAAIISPLAYYISV